MIIKSILTKIINYLSCVTYMVQYELLIIPRLYCWVVLLTKRYSDYTDFQDYCI